MFDLDFKVIEFVKNLFIDPYTQLVSLMCVLAAVKTIFPEKKK